MKLGCDYCKGEPEPGWIETLNNGPTVSCPMCNRNGDNDRAWRLAEAQRANDRSTTIATRAEKFQRGPRV